MTFDTTDARAERTRRFLSRVLLLACALGGFAAVPAPSSHAADKIRIAVVDFDTDAIHHRWRYRWSARELGRAAADNLASELVKNGAFRVIERQQLDRVLAEQNLGDSGRVDPSTAARIGKVLGVQLVVIGSVTEFGIDEKKAKVPQVGKWKWGRGVGGSMTTGKSALTARLVDTTTAEILGAYDGEGTHRFGGVEFSGASFEQKFDTGTASKVLAEAVDKLARDISEGASDLDPSTFRGGIEGKIAKVDGDTVYLNVGEGAGVAVGDVFVVKSQGEAIVDPDSGEILGTIESDVCKVEIVQIVNDRLCIAKIVSSSGTPSVGDRAVFD